MSNIISPSSLLLSATGTLAFKNCGLSDDVSTFTAPEMLQGRASSTKPAIERVSIETRNPESSLYGHMQALNTHLHYIKVRFLLHIFKPINCVTHSGWVFK